MIDQALIFNCDTPSAFILSRPNSLGILVKLSNHLMISANVPCFSGLQNMI